MTCQRGKFYRVEYPAYEGRAAHVIHVRGEASRDRHIAQIANKGCADFKVTELTADQYRAVALAKLKA